ncbi:MAG: hypothetical protein V4662_13165 [Verrucomicrobiota bacterium]
MTSDTSAMTAGRMHGLSSVRDGAARATLCAPPLARLWHQIRHEWQFQRWLVVVEWLLLGGAALASMEEKPGTLADLTLTPAAFLALLIIGRSVRADAPCNTDVMSHTRPVGRATVWGAKLLFLTFTLLLPWVLQALPQFRGFSFGAVEWFGVAMGTLLPAALLGTLTAALLSHARSMREGTALGFLALVLITGLVVATRNLSSQRDEMLCGAGVAALVLILSALTSWWLQSVRTSRRLSWTCLLLGGATACALPFAWGWDWRQVPRLAYTTTPLSLHIGSAPASGGQVLWPSLHLVGLPPDHVASVIALAPVSLDKAPWPPKGVISSDYTSVNTTTGIESQLWRWMTENHTEALAAHYPPGSLWLGYPVDDPRGPNLAGVLKHTLKTEPKAAEKPWRLRVAISRMHRVFSRPLGEAIREPIRVASPTPGYRLDFRLGMLDVPSYGGQILFSGTLKHRFPLLVPEGRRARIRPLGYLPQQNFMAVLHSPALGEVSVGQEGEDPTSPEPAVFLSGHSRRANFTLPHPRAQMDISGLSLEKWVSESTLDLWWPEEKGTLDLEITAEQMAEALAAENKLRPVSR